MCVWVWVSMCVWERVKTKLGIRGNLQVPISKDNVTLDRIWKQIVWPGLEPNPIEGCITDGLGERKREREREEVCCGKKGLVGMLSVF